jgi:hypothetical protein
MIGNDGKIFGYDNSLYKSNPQGLSLQAIAWRNRIVANGGSIDNTILQIIDKNLITPMVNTGIFDCLDRLNLYAGTGNRIAARTNIINDNYFVQEQNVANLNWIDQFGYNSIVVGSTGGYLTMSYNPATAPKWSADRFNNFQFIYGRFFNFNNAANMMGNGSGTATSHVAIVRNLSGIIGQAVTRVHANQTASTAVSGSYPPGTFQRYWFCATRGGNFVNNIVDSNVLTYNLPPATTIFSQEIAELTILGRTVGTSNHDLNSHQASGHGNNNFNNQTLRTFIINTLTALNS